MKNTEVHLKALKNNEKQWMWTMKYSEKCHDDITTNVNTETVQWKVLKNNEKQWRTMKNNENQWKPMKNNEHGFIVIQYNENHWISYTKYQ